MKVATCNNLLTKLASSKWGENPSTIGITALALIFSMVEYTDPVWERPPHAKNLAPELNQVLHRRHHMSVWKSRMNLDPRHTVPKLAHHSYLNDIIRSTM